MNKRRKAILLIFVAILLIVGYLFSDRKTKTISTEQFLTDIKVKYPLNIKEILLLKVVPPEDPEDTYTKLYKMEVKKEDILKFIKTINLKQEDNFYYSTIKELFKEGVIQERYNPPSWWEPCEQKDNIYWSYFTDKKGILQKRDTIHGYIAFQVCEDYTYVYIENAWTKNVSK